jgi:hypothetical protein
MRLRLVSFHDGEVWGCVEANGSKLSVEEKDLVIIGGGVAGYVAAIKAGQEGLKVSFHVLPGPIFPRAGVLISIYCRV